MNVEVFELITRRRHQLLVHSYIYYRLNDNLITDEKFDKWSMELVELQKEYPDEAKQAVYHEYFQDFDGSSGFDLPYHLPEVARRAENLIVSTRKIKGDVKRVSNPIR